ncbi:MAG: YybS family protein [Firmicutes bacterium]|nr:YybS family protein [Bacillota bacterium]
MEQDDNRFQEREHPYSLVPEEAESENTGDAANGDDGYSLPLSAKAEGKDAPPLSAPAAPGKNGGKTYYRQPPREWRRIPQAEERIGVKSLTEGAMMAAVAVVLAVIAVYVPVLNLAALLLFPLPATVLVLRRGVKMGVLVTAVVFLLTLIFFGLAQSVALLLQCGLLGLFLGYCFRYGKGPLFTLAIATVIAAFGALANMALSLYVMGMPWQSIGDEIGMMVREYAAALQSVGGESLFTAGGMTAEEGVEYFTALMQKLLPAVFILSSMLMAMLCYLIYSKVLRRMRYHIPSLPPFSQWRMDWRFSWGVIAGLLCAWVGSQAHLPWLNTVGVNILYIFFPILLICGFSCVVWIWKKLRIHTFVLVILIIIWIQFFAYVCILLALIGAFDPLLDFRSRLNKQEEEKR